MARTPRPWDHGAESSIIFPPRAADPCSSGGTGRTPLERNSLPVTSPHTLFEVSWEVCNKVGGIHTVVSTKAKSLVERHGDDYIAVGPWLLGQRVSEDIFEEERGFEGFAESCREIGLPVRVGRWRIPGRPRTILVEFSGLYEKKNDILAKLWEQHGVDSITGAWDYDEPVIFAREPAISASRSGPASMPAAVQP